MNCYLKKCMEGCEGACSILNECVFDHELIKDKINELKDLLNGPGKKDRIILRFFKKQKPFKVSDEQMSKDFVDGILKKYGQKRIFKKKAVKKKKPVKVITKTWKESIKELEAEITIEMHNKNDNEHQIFLMHQTKEQFELAKKHGWRVAKMLTETECNFHENEP